MHRQCFVAGLLGSHPRSASSAGKVSSSEKLVRVHLVINFCNRTEALHFFVHASISTACTVTLRLLGSNLTLVDLLIGVCVH